MANLPAAFIHNFMPNEMSDSRIVPHNLSEKQNDVFQGKKVHEHSGVSIRLIYQTTCKQSAVTKDSIRSQIANLDYLAPLIS